MAAITITQRKAYPFSDPILDATVMLPGPRTTEAIIKPGPIDLDILLIFHDILNDYAAVNVTRSCPAQGMWSG